MTLYKTPVVVHSGTKGNRWILTCYYCNKKGHIRLHYYQYLSNLKRVCHGKILLKKKIKQIWVRKTKAKCNMAYNSFKVMKEIMNNKKTVTPSKISIVEIIALSSHEYMRNFFAFLE